MFICALIFCQTPVVSKTLLPLDWKECGESKGCLLYPGYCKGNNCKSAVSFLVDTSNDTITFELMVQEAKYVSLGFSPDMTMVGLEFSLFIYYHHFPFLQKLFFAIF